MFKRFFFFSSGVFLAKFPLLLWVQDLLPWGIRAGLCPQTAVDDFSLNCALFCFLKGISAISFILEEKAVKMGEKSGQSQASLVSVLFWTSLSQFLAVVILFWADIIPGFGYTTNIQQFIQK